MPEGKDDRVVRIISELQVGVSGIKKNMAEAESTVKRGSRNIVDETQKMAKQIDAMWKQRERDDQKLVNQNRQMWEKRNRELQKVEKERLAHGRAVESQLAAEAKKRANEEVAAAKRVAAERVKARKQIDAEAKRVQREHDSAVGSLPGAISSVADTQAKMRYEQIHSLNLRNQAKEIREKLVALQQEYLLNQKLTAEQVKQLQTLRQQSQALNQQVNRIAADQRGTFAGNLKSMVGRRFEWLLAGSALFGTFNTIRAGVSDIADIETRMVALRRVMEDPAFDLATMQRDIFNLSQEFGFSFQQTHDIMLRWAQAGYDVQDSINATRASLLALNTAELDAEQSTQGLIGIMTQWGFEASELQNIIDKINKVSDDYSITSKDLVDALLRSSGAAKTAGMSFEELVALVTATKTAVGRDGAAIGTALNSIFNFFSRDKAQKVLQSSGIAVFADEAGTKLRPVFSLIEDMANNWDKFSPDMQQRLFEDAEAMGLLTEEMAEASGSLEEWTDLQKRDLLTAGAQSYRRNYLIGLLKNFSQVYDVLETQERALGYSQRENAQTMETYSKKVQQLYTALQELALSFAQEGGILDGLKNLVSGVRSAIEWYNNLSSTTKSVITIGLELAAVLGAVNYGLKTMTDKNIMQNLKVMFDKKTWTDMKNNILGVVSAMGGWGASLAAIGPLAVGVAALAYTLVHVNNEAMRLQNTFEETRRQMDATIQGYEAQAKIHSQNITLLQRLGDEYRTLTKVREEAEMMAADPAVLDEYAARQQVVSDKVASALGQETAARLKAQGYSRKVVDAMIEAEQEKAKEARENADKAIASYQDTLRAQILEAQDSIKVLETKQGAWVEFLNFQERGTAIQIAAQSIALKVIEQMWNNLFDSLREMYEQWSLQFAGLAIILDKIGAPEWLSNAAEEAATFFGKASTGALKLGQTLDGVVEKWRNDLRENVGELVEEPLARQKKLLVDLLAEVDKLDGLKSGGDDDGTNNGFIVNGDGDVSTLIDRIVAETEAIGKRSAAVEREIALLQQRIAYNTREGASLDELTQADADRVRVIELLADRQAILHVQAQAAREAYAALAAAQAKTNKSTEDGMKAYNELGDAMEKMLSIAGENSAEWWSLEKQKADILKENNAATTTMLNQLNDLRQSYDDGLISLEAYIDGLAKLDEQVGLTEDAMKQLNGEQAKAFKEKWSTDLATALKDAQKEIQDQIKLLDDVVKAFDRSESAEERVNARNALSKSLTTLQGGTSSASMPSLNEVSSLVQTVMDKFASIDLGDLDPASFAALIGADLTALDGFADTAQSLMESVGEAASRRLKEIADELKVIDEDLQIRLDELQAELDALDEEDKQAERTKSTEEHTKRQQTLQDQLNWYLLQGEEEYAFEIAAIRKQMADEEKQWSETQNDWRKDDQRQAIRDQMEAVRKEAEERKRALEAEREELQEQQRVMTETLNSLLQYIVSELAARKEVLQGEKDELTETSKAIDETMQGVTDKVLGTLSVMAAQQPEFYNKGQGLVQKLIDGLKSKKGELQSTVDEINALFNQAQTSNVPTNTTTTPPLDANIGPIPQMASGAYVKARPGVGILANIGEGVVDEYVDRVDKIQPRINTALINAMRSNAASGSTFGFNADAIAAAVQRGLANVNFFAVVETTTDTGMVRREIVRFVQGAGLSQSVRAG